MAKPLTEIVYVRPVMGDGGVYHFVVKFSGDRSDFTCFLEAEVTVTAKDLLDFGALQTVVLEQSGLFLQINGADENKATWLDRVEKFLELPPKA